MRKMKSLTAPKKIEKSSFKIWIQMTISWQIETNHLKLIMLWIKKVKVHISYPKIVTHVWSNSVSGIIASLEKEKKVLEWTKNGFISKNMYRIHTKAGWSFPWHNAVLFQTLPLLWSQLQKLSYPSNFYHVTSPWQFKSNPLLQNIERVHSSVVTQIQRSPWDEGEGSGEGGLIRWL